MTGAQLALDVSASRPAFGRGDFFVSPCNAQAVAAVDRWPVWPQSALVLCGAEGSGKTHLSEVWRARSGAQALAMAAFADLGPERARAGAWLIDGVAPDDPLETRAETGRAGEVALCRMLDGLAAGNASLLITARVPPSAWSIASADLRTRLAGLAFVELGPPDETLLENLVGKLFTDRQLDVPYGVIQEIVAVSERSFRAVQSAVEAIDRASLVRKQRILTRPFVHEVLAGLAAGR